MAAAQASPSSDDLAVSQARRAIEESNTKLARYRAALDAGADPVVVTGWIAQAQAEKTTAERKLREARKEEERTLTREEISTMVETLGDMASALAEAEPAEKADLYRQLNLRLTYQPTTSTVRADMKISATYCGVMDRVRGGT
ncbi:hypothetical protein [Frankia tisae]|uniref:hypothetical protein n=1 Tax=Frankia tisae TaxID=2950104 RepID=UPI0021C035A1|nr:hypothetical protein [Frankia tisae]